MFDRNTNPMTDKEKALAVLRGAKNHKMFIMIQMESSFPPEDKEKPMTPQAKLRLRLISLVDDLMFETQQFPGQTDWPKAKIRDLVLEIEKIVEKLLERS